MVFGDGGDGLGLLAAALRGFVGGEGGGEAAAGGEGEDRHALLEATAARVFAAVVGHGGCLAEVAGKGVVASFVSARGGHAADHRVGGV